MSEWIEYTGSYKQIEEIRHCEHGYIKKFASGLISLVLPPDECVHFMEIPTHYLICEPHPYADLIDIWRLSGCPVWIRQLIRNYTFPECFNNKYDVVITNTPDWNIPGAEYRLTPFED